MTAAQATTPRAPSRFRTGPELAAIRALYPEGGAPAVIARYPHLEPYQVYNAAQALGVRRVGLPPRRVYPPCERIDDQIRRLYADSPARGEVCAFAERIGRPHSWVTARATKLGLVRPRLRTPPWSAAEDEILELTMHLHPKSVVLRLAKQGFNRTQTAVVVRRKRLKLWLRDDPDRWSARQLAELMGIDNKKVCRWITSGRLIAKRRGTERTERQGGDEWLIKRADLRRFMTSHLADWDHRRCDQLFLVEILAGSVGGEV